MVFDEIKYMYELTRDARAVAYFDDVKNVKTRGGRLAKQLNIPLGIVRIHMNELSTDINHLKKFIVAIDVEGVHHYDDDFYHDAHLDYFLLTDPIATKWGPSNHADMREATKEVRRLDLVSWFKSRPFEQGVLFTGDNKFDRLNTKEYNADTGMTRSMLVRALQYYYTDGKV